MGRTILIDMKLFTINPLDFHAVYESCSLKKFYTDSFNRSVGLLFFFMLVALQVQPGASVVQHP
jgi:hypothetical protein